MTRMKQHKDHSVPWWTSCRLCLAVVGFVGFVHAFAQRVCMSVAIICMVNQTALQSLRPATILLRSNLTLVVENGTSDAGGCLADDTAHETLFEDGKLLLDKEMQSHVHGAFFYGYLVSQVPAGLLAEKVGGKWVLAACMLMSSAATLVTPVAASSNYALLLTARVLVGVGSGAMFPVMHSIWSHWAPPTERSTLTSLTYAGAWMGNVIALPFSGLMCRSGPGEGWPTIFYVIGASSVAWLIVWCVLTTDTPSKHPRISAAELDYIVHSLEGQVVDHSKKRRMPVLRMLTSLPVWATAIGGFTSDWGLYTFLTNIPTYLHEVLHLDVQSNGLYSALPFLVLWGNMNLSPVIADRLLASKRFTTGFVRKLFHCIGSVGAAVFLVGLSFLDCHHPGLAITLLTVGVAITAACYSGYFISMMDFAPKYAGTLVGFANSLAACSGFIAPYVAAVLTPNRTRAEWQRVFFLAAGVYCAGAAAFCVLGSGELQSWARDEESSDDKGGEKAAENSPKTAVRYSFSTSGTVADT